MWFRAVGLSIVLLYTSCALAQPNTDKPTGTKSSLSSSKQVLSKKSGGFITKPKVPAGFENLDVESETILDVYYGGIFIGSFDAKYTSTYVILNQPQNIVKDLKNVTNAAVVTQALTGKLATNTRLLCTSQYAPNCGVLSPNVAGLIFDPARFRVDIFVNPSYVYGESLKQKFLPGSDADFSYINNISAAGTGTGNQASYNFNSQNVVAYREARLNAAISYANTPGTQIEQTQVNNLNAGWNYDRYQLSGGMVTTYSDPLIPTENLLGVSLQTSSDVFLDNDDTYGSPIQLFLYSPSKVSAYRDGRLIGTGFYQAGKQQLDTSTFPEGAYTVLLEIESQTGQVTQEYQSFVKTTRLPPLAYPTYFFNAGYLSDSVINNNIFPEYSNTILYQAGLLKRFLPKWGYNAMVEGEPNNSFMTAGIFFINSYVQINPDILVGSHGEKGIALSSQLNIGPWFAGLYGNQIWAYYHNVPTDIEEQDMPVSSDDFSPIVGDSKTLGGNLGSSVGNLNLSISGSINEREGQGTTYSVGPDVRIPLTTNAVFNTSLELSATRTDSDMIYLATIRAYLNPPHSNWMHTISVGYNVDNPMPAASTSSNPSNNNTGVVATTNSTWQDLDQAQEGVRLGINTSYYLGQSSAGLSVDDGWDYGHFNGQVQQNVSQGLGNINSQNTQYAATLSTNLVYTRELAALGGASYGETGVIVEVTSSRKTSDEFEVLVNNQVRKVIEVNTPTAILLDPYNTYQVRVQSIGETLFDYQESPRMITLYRGNIKPLIWKTSEKIVLFTKILQANGNPLSTALIQGGVGINQTDDDGSLQLEVSSETRLLKAKLRNGHECEIHLPEYQSEGGVAQLAPITCQPVGLAADPTRYAATTSKTKNPGHFLSIKRNPAILSDEVD